MEENYKVNGSGENGSTSEGRPPIPIADAYKQCFSATRVSSTCKKTLVRHPSLVFDGHGGKHAAHFACCHLPHFIFEDEEFPRKIERVIISVFLQTDNAFVEACSLDAGLASGTTALAALVLGRSLVVANASDCRAVLCRRGKAIEMSRDHKPHCSREKKRIEASGGYVDDGYLNGQLNVARALGDWHIEGMKEADRGGGPLTA